jgi:thymidylate kinase
MNPHGFYVFEGDHAVGKSTVIEAIARVVPATVMQLPTTPIREIAEYIHSHSTRAATLGYYLCAVADATPEIEAARNNSLILCHRYILSSFALYASAARLDLQGKDSYYIDFFKMIQRQIARPDHTFLLTCDSSIRRARIHADKSRPSRLANLDSLYSPTKERALRALASYCVPCTAVDTTNTDVDSIVNQVLDVLRQ